MQLECLAVVFVDIKDYTTKTSDQSRGANERLLARFAALVKPMVRAFKGTVVKGLGDAYLITFKSPTDSLLCAMAVQDQLSQRNTLLPKEEQFEIRFAINAGEVRIEKRDVFGEAVNIAARIEALTQGGEIYFSESVYLMMNKSEVPFEEVGLQSLKGIQEQVLVYRVPKLEEVGTYRLAQPEAESEQEADRPVSRPLPFGGLGLTRVHTHVTGTALEADGSFYLLGAVSEVHYAASTHAARFWAGPWYAKELGPLDYLARLGGGLALLPFSPRSWRGLAARLRKSARLVRESPSHRANLLMGVLLVLLLLAGGLLGWFKYAEAKQARELQLLEQQKEEEAAKEQARALEAQKAAETAKRLNAQLKKQKKVAAVAKAKADATQKALEKEKSKFHLPWQ